jgi:hypothetical protein
MARDLGGSIEHYNEIHYAKCTSVVFSGPPPYLNEKFIAMKPVKSSMVARLCRTKFCNDNYLFNYR